MLDPAIVCSASDIASLTVAQTLGRQGVPIIALSNVRHAPTFYSRYVRRRHLTPIGAGGSESRENTREPDELLDYLLEHVERGVLFPGSDGNVRFLARHKQRLLEAGFRLCIPDEPVLLTALNKSDVARFCVEHGFPVPRTVVVRDASDLERVADELTFPIVLKGVYKKNHRLVDHIDRLPAEYEAFLGGFVGKSDEIESVAQEWIPGTNDAFGKLYVMCDAQGRVVASHQLRRLRVHTRKDGSQGDTLAAKTERIEALSRQWMPFFERLGWTGMASMECKLDARDGLFKLVEINPRPWAILKISVDAGVDIPTLYYRLARGESVATVDGFEEGRYYIRALWGRNGIPEPVATLGMLLHGHIGLGETLALYLRMLRNVRRLSIDGGRLSDPLPTLAAIYHHGIRGFKQWF